MRKNIISLILSVLLFVISPCLAQTGGLGVFRFINLPNASKTTALGNIFPVSTDADLSQTFQNPSLIAKNHAGLMGLNYSNFVSDINFGSIQYGLKIKNEEVVSASLQFVNYGNFEETDAAGNATGNTFSASDYLLNIGYGKNWKQKIYYGANAKIIYGAYDIYSSFAIATDIAVTYKDTIKNFAVGIIFKNIGYQLKPFNQIRENLPFEIALSFSQKLKYAPFRYHVGYNNLQNFDLTYQDPNKPDAEIDLITGEPITNKASFTEKFSRHLVFGAEVLLSQSFNLQAGYNLQRSKELGNVGVGGLAGFSFGFMLNLKKLSIGYANSRLNAAGSNNYFSMLIKPSIFKTKNR